MAKSNYRLTNIGESLDQFPSVVEKNREKSTRRKLEAGAEGFDEVKPNVFWDLWDAQLCAGWASQVYNRENSECRLITIVRESSIIDGDFRFVRSKTIFWGRENVEKDKQMGRL